MKHRLKIIFAGTPEFAAVALRGMLAAAHDVVAVYCQPDRPAGRGRKIASGAVKAVALDAGIPVYQPLSLKDQAAQLEMSRLEADVMVVVAYGLILPQAVLNIPTYGCFNIHASLLPRWRGAAPIQRAILAGDQQTGVTIMQMDAGLDTGDMLLKLSCPINPCDNSQSLHDKLARLGSQAILQILEQLAAIPLTLKKQNEDLSCYAAKLSKSEAVIDWSLSARVLDRQIRAFNPWPVSQTTYQDKTLRIWNAEVVASIEPSLQTCAYGEILSASKQGIDVATGDQTVLRITQLQLPGGKPIDAASFLNAHKPTGIILGAAIGEA